MMDAILHSGMFWGIVGLTIIITFAFTFMHYDERKQAKSKS